MVAVRYDEAVAAWAGFYWNGSAIILKGAAFVVIFFVVYFVFAVAGWGLHRAAKVLFLQTLNRLGGMAVGLGNGTAVTALLISLVTSWAWIPRTTRERVEDTYIGPHLSQLAVKLIRIGKEKLLPEENGQALIQLGVCCS